MGRSKQSARKYEGASAPSQMACSTPQAFQQYMSCQQSAGPSASNQERIFVNHENSFSGFSFQRATTDQEIQPAIHVARVQNYSSDPHEPAIFVRLDFLSRFDGRADLLAATRAPLDAVFVVDVSGSMSCAFPDDSDRRDKLAVAVQAIERILTKLAPGDRVSIVKFNNTADVILPLVDFTKTTSEQASTVLSTLRANGGTNLHRGLQGGFGALNIDESVQTTSTAEDSTPRSRRVFFLTDMESDHHDELEMIETAKTFARHDKKPSYFTVVTIGVDLSMDSVERINAVPGSRYMSVVSAREMHATLVQDFDYDIAPLAFDIHCQMPANITIDKCYGSVELQNLAAGSSGFTVSTEFPVPRSSDQQSRGGIYLLRISSVGDVAGTEEMQFRWRDRAGVSHECAVPLGSAIRALGSLTSSDDNVSAGCDIGLRKACALVRYVDTLTSYVKPTKPTFRAHESISHAQQMADMFQQQLSVQSQLLPSQIPSQQLQQLPAFSQPPYPPQRQQPMQSSQPPTPQRRSFTSYLSSFVLPRAAPAETLPVAVAAPAFDDNEAIVLTLPASHDGSSAPETLSFTLSDLLSVDAHDPRLQHLPAYLVPSHTAVLRFQNLRTYLQSELAVHCQDLSLAPGGENHNIRQTLDQIIELETEELRRGLQRWRLDMQTTASFGH